MTARLGTAWSFFTAAALLCAAAVWSVHHYATLAGLVQGRSVRVVSATYAVMWIVLLAQTALCYLNLPVRRLTRRRQRRLDEMNVACLVPVYNEDPQALLACLRSALQQERPPNSVVVVDDGTPDATATGYEHVRAEFLAAAESHGVRGVWLTQPNLGKRHAQGAGVRATPDADAYWTVDSDTISDPRALRELLKPLNNPAVQSVAGVVLAANIRTPGRGFGLHLRYLLARIVDLWFVTGQLTDRSALSVLRCVWVNSGPIAVYRAEVVRDNLDGYLAETFMGRPVPFSDDSLLTLYAMTRGHTVQQPSAFAFSLMPTRVRHHVRQYTRWMRGSSIRSLWRAKYLPLIGVAWWVHLLRWAQTAASTVVLALVVWSGAVSHSGWWWIVAVPVCVGYAQTLRYMIVIRSDVPRLYQWGTWLLTPLAVVWALLVLRPLRWWGVATCWRTEWGTRKSVEVTLDSPARTG